MKYPHQPFLNPSYLCLLALVFGPLAMAISSESLWGFKPCHLCMIQRIPYAVMTMLVIFQGLIRSKTWMWLLLMVGFIASTIAASYHVGVEKGLIALSEGCLGAPSTAKTSQQLLQELLSETKPRCDKPTMILGFSMATWNLAYSAAMVFYFGFLTSISFKSAKRIQHD
ncbi:MAG: disulfide bond formation protein B [Alphaproteobacteria bacterium]|nr:disulfide bond formation protein B [Alphaproteobacteria bacterium]